MPVEDLVRQWTPAQTSGSVWCCKIGEVVGINFVDTHTYLDLTLKHSAHTNDYQQATISMLNEKW